MMDHFQLDEFQLPSEPSWEELLNQFEQVMASGTVNIRVKAIIKLAQLSKTAPEDILSRTIPALVEILNVNPVSFSGEPVCVQQAAAYCLKCISLKGSDQLGRKIVQFGAVQSILRLVPRVFDHHRRILVKCFWSLVVVNKVNWLLLDRNDALEVVLAMLGSCSDGSRKYLLEILAVMALLREVRSALVNSGGLPFLIEAAGSGSIVSRVKACQAIGLLGRSRRVRFLLVELGVIPVLVELLRDGDDLTKIIAGNALGVVSADTDYIRPLAEAGAIPLYAGLLQGPDPIGREIAEDVFCLLSVAEENAVVIAEYLVGILIMGDDEAKAAAADVFWDISDYSYSTSVVRNSGAIPILVGLLKAENVLVREKVSGAIAQLCYEDTERAAVVAAGAIPDLVELLQDESDEVKDNVAEALISISDDPSQRQRLDEAIDTPSFQEMRNRLNLIRASNEFMIRTSRQMIIERLSRDRNPI